MSAIKTAINAVSGEANGACCGNPKNIKIGFNRPNSGLYIHFHNKPTTGGAIAIGAIKIK